MSPQTGLVTQAKLAELECRLTRVLILEVGHIVDVLVNDDPQAVALAVGGDLVLAESLRHGDGRNVGKVMRGLK